MVQSLKRKELSNFANSNSSLAERFQVKAAMSCANAADLASFSQIFSKLSPWQRVLLGEWLLVEVGQIRKHYNNISLL